MITRVRGILLEKTPPRVVVELSHGLAYELEVSMTTFYRLADIGKEVIFETHLQVREDAHVLYGFLQAEERSLFRALIKVNGIGPKVALSILSSMETTAFIECILENNKGALERIPGIGKKTAERLILEMQDRLSEWKTVLPSAVSNLSQNELGSGREKMILEAANALVSLGYKVSEARRAVTESAKNNHSLETIIQHALRGMG